MDGEAFVVLGSDHLCRQATFGEQHPLLSRLKDLPLRLQLSLQAATAMQVDTQSCATQRATSSAGETIPAVNLVWAQQNLRFGAHGYVRQWLAHLWLTLRAGLVIRYC